MAGLVLLRLEASAVLACSMVAGPPRGRLCRPWSARPGVCASRAEQKLAKAGCLFKQPLQTQWRLCQLRSSRAVSSGRQGCTRAHQAPALGIALYIEQLVTPCSQVHKFGGTCLATARRIADAAQLVVDRFQSSGDQQMVVVSAMGSHITSPVKVVPILPVVKTILSIIHLPHGEWACMQVTDLLLEMVAKAARQDQAFLIDLAALQEKHIETAKLLLEEGQALNTFASRLLDDIANLKAMLHAISIGETPQTFHLPLDTTSKSSCLAHSQESCSYLHKCSGLLKAAKALSCFAVRKMISQVAHNPFQTMTRCSAAVQPAW